METKKITIGKQILSQDDLKIHVTYNSESYTMHYPNPLEKSLIEGEIARRLGGLPREAHSQDNLAQIEAATYVENLIIHEESPGWFVSAWTCLDEVLIATLYAGYITFRDTFRNKLAKGEFSVPS